MKKVISWFEIYTSDFGRAKKFYREVFQVELIDVPMASSRHPTMLYATFSSGKSSEVNGGLVKIEEAKPGIGGTLIYFETEEITTELNRVEVLLDLLR